MAEPTFFTAARPAEEAATLLEAALLQAGPGARLAVAGGSAAAALGLLRRRLAPAFWKTLRLTWVDERCVPFDDPESNRGAAHRAGHLDAQAPPALELPLYLDGETPQAACSRVAEAFRRGFCTKLDVLLLGLGEDGHIASLFPGRFWMGGPLLAVEDSPKPPARRITLSLPVLIQAHRAILLAAGEGKREALGRLHRGDPGLPGSALPHLDIITDLNLESRP